MLGKVVILEGSFSIWREILLSLQGNKHFFQACLDVWYPIQESRQSNAMYGQVSTFEFERSGFFLFNFIHNQS